VPAGGVQLLRQRSIAVVLGEKCPQNSHFFSLFGSPGVICGSQSSIGKSSHDK
jgi:hypothetical protein